MNAVLTLAATALVLAVVAFAIQVLRLGPTWVLHNVVAHPLLVLCPPLGERLHDRTAPPEDNDLLTVLLDRLAQDPTRLAPYVLVAPAALIPMLDTAECIALARAGITHLPETFMPGSVRCSWATPPEPSADDARGVLLVPAELVA